MRHLLILLPLLVACGPVPDCETPSGVLLFGSRDCSGLERHAQRSLELFAEHVPDWRPPGFALHGLVVEVLEDGAAGIAAGSQSRRAFGLASCEGHMIRLPARERWEASGLTHELAHLVDECRDTTVPGALDDHERWYSSGHRAAEWEAQGPGFVWTGPDGFSS